MIFAEGREKKRSNCLIRRPLCCSTWTSSVPLYWLQVYRMEEKASIGKTIMVVRGEKCEMKGKFPFFALNEDEMGQWLGKSLHKCYFPAIWARGGGTMTRAGCFFFLLVEVEDQTFFSFCLLFTVDFLLFLPSFQVCLLFSNWFNQLVLFQCYAELNINKKKNWRQLRNGTFKCDL